MANDEVLIKVAADLSQLKEDFNNQEALWTKHNQAVKEGEKAIKDYVKTTVAENKKVDKAIQSNIDKVAAEGKALDALEKKFETLGKKNEKSFDTKKIDDFNNKLASVSKNINNLEQFDLDVDDIDYLTKKLSTAQDDFEALNVLVDFFEGKMKSSASSVADSFDVIKKKIDETKLNISSTEGFIKEIDKRIDKTAPGLTQASLITERDAAAQALREEKVALADYQSQLKKAREENVSMATQLRRVKDELVQLEIEGKRGGDRWIELSEKAETYNDAIASTNSELRRTASTTQGLDNIIGAATGIVAAFTVAQGATALFGEENEDLEKSLVKVTGAIALLNGLQQIQTELSKKETIAAKALTFVRAQYALATDAGAKSTVRLAAATKLLGIGLLVGALAAIVVYWKDISKFIGIISDKTERLNDVQKKSNEIAGDQIAKLSILVDRVKEGELSFIQKTEAVENYNKEFGSTLGTVKSYTELEKKLIEQGADYIAYLGLKARAEAAYQLAVEKSKEALEKRNNTEIGLTDVAVSAGSFVGQATGGQFLTPGEVSQISNNVDANDLENDSKAFLEEQEKLQAELEKLAKKLGITIKTENKDLVKEYEKLSDVLASLIDQQEAYRINAIENSREREKEILKARLNDERDKYKSEIDNLKVSEEKKAKLREAFNKLYNEQTGAAYEQLRKDIAAVDKKYNEELESVQFKALSAIDAILVSETENDREAIQERWDNIRDEIEDQIEKTNDKFKKEGLRVVLDEIDTAESKELETFDRGADLDRVDREKEIAQSILAIQQANISEIINNEELKRFQLLNLERDYLNEILSTYQDSFDSLEDQGLFNELVDTLVNSLDSDEILEAGNKLKEAFGEDIAKEVLQTVGALKEVGNEIDEIAKKSGSEIGSEIAQAFGSIEGFAKKLGETLGIEGEKLNEFIQAFADFAIVTYDSIKQIAELEVQERQAKVNAIEEEIDSVEDELEREQQLYEDGYANNYDARKEDLEDLKARKKEEEEELQKAQKRRAAFQKAEFLIQTAEQLGNLITSATNIFRVATSLLGPFGVPVAIAAIGTMFGAFAVAKTKAFQAIGDGGGQSFRRGLGEGALSLSGPRHEEKGFGLYNSKTGERVAEFEDGEDVLVVNRSQKKKYKHIIDALIADAQGRSNIDSTLESHYHVPSVGRESLKVIKRVNEITVKSQRNKEEASNNDTKLLEQITKFREEFKDEFKGHRNERDDEIKAWETKEFFYVKKGNKTKKYRKE